MNEDVSVNFCGNGAVIVTENTDGEIYMITATLYRPTMLVCSLRHGMESR